MKYIALVKIRDRQMMHSWHSGNCDTYESKANCKSKEEAETFIKEIEVKYERHNAPRSEDDKYRLTPCILNYDEGYSENVEAFFKYM